MKAVLSIAASATLLIAGAVQAHPGAGHAEGARFNAASSHARGYLAHRSAGESRVQTYYSDTGWQPGLNPVAAYGYGYGYGGAGHAPPVMVAPYQAPIQYGYSQPIVSRSQPFDYPVDGYGRYPWSRTGQGQVSYQQGNYTQGQRHGHGHGCGCEGPVYQGHPIHQQAQPVIYRSAPVYYSQPPVHISQPPIYVQSAPVYVEAAQVHVSPPPIHVAAPQVHVDQPRVEVAPPQVHFEQGFFAVEPPPPPPPPQPASPTERPYRQEPGERG